MCLSSCHKSACLQEAGKSLAPGPQLAGWGQDVNCVLRSGLPWPENRALLQIQWWVQGPLFPSTSPPTLGPGELAVPSPCRKAQFVLSL